MTGGKTKTPAASTRRVGKVALPVVPAVEPLPAGPFSEWLQTTRSARDGECGVAVPCGECNACCRSSLFIHIRPEETDTLSHIDPRLLFPAPGAPPGHQLLGYGKRGRCPMLKDSGCSIYEHRPRTCRDFDCRTLAATTLVLDHAQQAIAEQAQRWRFEYPRDEDDRQHVAVRATAAFLLERGPELLPGLLPSHPLQLAMLAVCVYDVFYPLGDGSQQTRPPDDELARAILTAMARGEADETPARAISVKRGPGDQP